MNVKPAEIVEWYKTVVTKRYAMFTGRARRMEFWSFFLGNVVIGIVLAIVSSIIRTDILSSIFSLAVLIPSIAVGIRRLHDINKSGWYMLISLIPFGIFFVLYLQTRPGDVGSNQYGEDPKA